MAIHGVQKETSEEEIFAHLPEHEAAILKRQLDVPPVNIGSLSLYRHATRNDVLIIIVSGICAIAAGVALPLMTVVFGSLAGSFQAFLNGSVTANFSNKLSHLTLYFVYLGIGEFVTVYITTVGFIYAGQHIAGKIREHYLASILRKNSGYFDKLGAGEIIQHTHITSDTNLVQDDISEKVGLTLTAVATFIAANIIAIILTTAGLGRFIYACRPPQSFLD